MPAAVPSAINADTTTAIRFRTGPTGNFTGRSLMMITPSVPISPKPSGFNARKAA
jgi:hypothetical protein